MKFYFLILMAWFLIPCCLQAENLDGKVEITVHSGISFLEAARENNIPCRFCVGPVQPPFDIVFQEKSSLDNSFVFGFKGGYYLNNKAEIEGNFAVAPSHDFRFESGFFCPPGEICPLRDVPVIDTPVFLFQENAVVYHYDANFSYHFSEQNVRPFFTLGVGGVSTDLQQDTRTDFTFNFGVGGKFYFDRLGLRFEINDHVIPGYFLTDDTEHDVQVQYGILFHL